MRPRGSAGRDVVDGGIENVRGNRAAPEPMMPAQAHSSSMVLEKDAALVLTGITKTFGAVRALKGVAFSLAPGEVHAVVGENGAGKSTLIKIITGAHRPDSGTL